MTIFFLPSRFSTLASRKWESKPNDVRVFLAAARKIADKAQASLATLRARRRLPQSRPRCESACNHVPIGEIRRAHFREGRSIKGISRDLGVSRTTARKVLRPGATEFVCKHRTQPRPKIDPWQSELEEGQASRQCRKVNNW